MFEWQHVFNASEDAGLSQRMIFSVVIGLYAYAIIRHNHSNCRGATNTTFTQHVLGHLGLCCPRGCLYLSVFSCLCMSGALVRHWQRGCLLPSTGFSHNNHQQALNVPPYKQAHSETWEHTQMQSHLGQLRPRWSRTCLGNIYVSV